MYKGDQIVHLSHIRPSDIMRWQDHAV